MVFAFVVLEVLAVGCFFDLVVDFVLDLTVLDFGADRAVVVLAVVVLARVVDVLREVAAALRVLFTGALDVVVLLLLFTEGLRVDIVRVVLVAFFFAVVAFDGVDFFRVDDVFVVLEVAVFRFVVAAFLVAILTLPAK